MMNNKLNKIIKFSLCQVSVNMGGTKYIYSQNKRFINIKDTYK